MIVSQSVRSKLAGANSPTMRLLMLKNNVRHCLERWPSVLLLIMIFTLTACSKKPPADEEIAPEETEKVSQLRQEVIAVHDEVMPLMTDIYQLKTKLKDKVAAGDIPAGDRPRVDAILLELDSADRGMRDWMRSFSKVTTAGVPETEALSTLNGELEKIKKVKDDMIESVTAAKAFE